MKQDENESKNTRPFSYYIGAELQEAPVDYDSYEAEYMNKPTVIVPPERIWIDVEGIPNAHILGGLGSYFMRPCKGKQSIEYVRADLPPKETHPVGILARVRERLVNWAADDSANPNECLIEITNLTAGLNADGSELDERQPEDRIMPQER